MLTTTPTTKLILATSGRKRYSCTSATVPVSAAAAGCGAHQPLAADRQAGRVAGGREPVLVPLTAQVGEMVDEHLGLMGVDVHHPDQNSGIPPHQASDRVQDRVEGRV